MAQALTYRGYSARVEYSPEDEVLVGRVVGITDLVSFHGESVTEMRQAFHDAVDSYLISFEARGEPPQKPYSGQVMFRIPPELHARAATSAASSGKSLNQWATEVIERAAT